MHFATETKAAMRFWEPARVPFNLLLVAATLVALPSGAINQDTLTLVIFAVLANLLYLTAYPVDLFLQFGATKMHRLSMTTMRWMVWALGTATALLITVGVCSFVSLDMSN